MKDSSKRAVKSTLYDLGLALAYLLSILVVIILANVVSAFFWIPAVILSSVLLIKGLWFFVRESNSK